MAFLGKDNHREKCTQVKQGLACAAPAFYLKDENLLYCQACYTQQIRRMLGIKPQPNLKLIK